MHTQGEWTISQNLSPIIYSEVEGVRTDICKILAADPPVKEMKANARLIAAAPDLLAVCKAIAKSLECFCLDEPEMAGREPCEVCKCQTAIDKVEKGQ